MVETGGVDRSAGPSCTAGSSAIAAGLAAAGVRPGHRVALLVPPSIDLTVALYAVWRAGAVIVVADKGLGLRGMGRALRSAQLDHLIADTAGLLAAGPMRLPGTRIAVRPPSAVVRAAVRGAHLAGRARTARRRRCRSPPSPDPAAEAAVLFTSGATGPAKGVRYRDGQVRAQLALIGRTYGLTAGRPHRRRLRAVRAVRAGARASRRAVPDTDVTKPGTLTAVALADGRRPDRRHRRLRLPGRAAQRAGHRGRADRRRSGRRWPGCGC